MTGCPKRWLILGVLLAAGAALSGCGAADEMFDGGGSAPVAHANPRDQARARSLRCDALPDERNWLDCYYGAAQPVRAELSLPPAPAAQQALVPAAS
ncbi:MAG TPA: hypothetical protein VMU31_07850 [Rhizomicrobium sp.]|nr:hypothetical protein [Rhizomicrobium sp.]